MDALSRLIRLARLRGSVDVRCLVAGSHTLDNPATEKGRAPFHVLLSGACTLELPDRSIDLVAGDMVLLPRGTEHRVHVAGQGAAAGVTRRDDAPLALITNVAGAEGGLDDPVDLFCGHYTWGTGPGQVLMDMLPDVVHVTLERGDAGEDDGTALGSLSALMRDEARRAGPGTEAVLDALSDVLLTLALRGTPGLGGAVWLASTHDVVRSVHEAVLSDPAHAWRIEELAALNAMSRATFIRYFTRETGMSPGDFLTRLRMLLATDMLTRTDRSVAAIAAAVGYGSESSFGRIFRLTTGDTPAQLRRAARALQ